MHRTVKCLITVCVFFLFIIIFSLQNKLNQHKFESIFIEVTKKCVGFVLGTRVISSYFLLYSDIYLIYIQLFANHLSPKYISI